MKALSRILLLLLGGAAFFLPSANAQAPAQGAFRLVNATGLPQKTLFTVDGAKVKASGFDDGFASGLVGILAGSHTIVANYAGGGSAQQVVQVAANSSSSVYAYTKPKLDPATQKVTRSLALGVRENPVGVKGKRVFLLNVTDKALSLSLNGQARNIESLREAAVENFSATEIILEVGTTQLGRFSSEEKGNYLIIIYQEATGSTLKCAFAPDFG